MPLFDGWGGTKFDVVFLSNFSKWGVFVLIGKPEFFKTHPTFVFSQLLMPSMACQTLITLFFGTPCTILIVDIPA